MQRVLVVESGSLLDEGVASLLAQESDLHVSGIAYANDTAFLQDISDARPDVILLNEAGPLDSVRILELLKSIPTLASLRVIVVRLDDNVIDMYEKQSVNIAQKDDLIALIRHDQDRA